MALSEPMIFWDQPIDHDKDSNQDRGRDTSVPTGLGGLLRKDPINRRMMVRAKISSRDRDMGFEHQSLVGLKERKWGDIDNDGDRTY